MKTLKRHLAFECFINFSNLIISGTNEKHLQLENSCFNLCGILCDTSQGKNLIIVTLYNDCKVLAKIIQLNLQLQTLLVSDHPLLFSIMPKVSSRK